ncbi:MAG: hypothetical protein WC468_00810 [Candidatus Paceibacterota bacterium]
MQQFCNTSCVPFFLGIVAGVVFFALSVLSGSTGSTSSTGGEDMARIAMAAAITPSILFSRAFPQSSSKVYYEGTINYYHIFIILYRA